MVHDCFNTNFTDADAAALVSNAPIATQPQNYYHTCGWRSGDSICSSHVLGHEFSEHLRDRHGIVGPDKTMMTCGWTGCLTPMRKESLVRHVQEKHLEWRYPCPNCHEQFTRNYTKVQHITKKHRTTG